MPGLIRNAITPAIASGVVVYPVHAPWLMPCWMRMSGKFMLAAAPVTEDPGSFRPFAGKVCRWAASRLAQAGMLY